MGLDRNGQPTNKRFNQGRNVEKAVSGMLGILQGLTADQRIGEREVLFLDAWLRNKTAAQWEIWVAREDALLLVAEQQSAIVGVAAATLRGEILLNYVHPEARFSGVSKAMLAALEDELGRHNVAQSRLKSTVTARPFYVSCGYRSETSGDYLAKDLRK